MMEAFEWDAVSRLVRSRSIWTVYLNCLLSVAEEVWYLSAWRIRSGTGTIPHLASEPTPHPWRLPLPSLHPALPALNPSLSHTHAPSTNTHHDQMRFDLPLARLRLSLRVTLEGNETAIHASLDELLSRGCMSFRYQNICRILNNKCEAAQVRSSWVCFLFIYLLYSSIVFQDYSSSHFFFGSRSVCAGCPSCHKPLSIWLSLRRGTTVEWLVIYFF